MIKIMLFFNKKAKKIAEKICNCIDIKSDTVKSYVKKDTDNLLFCIQNEDIEKVMVSKKLFYSRVHRIF